MPPFVRLKDRKKNKNKAISETPTYPETDLGRLLKRAASGDYEAFGEIYTMYLDRIYRYVFYQVKDKMVAEDLTEEIFVKAWTAMKAYKGEKLSFSTWLYRIAHNHTIDYFRTAQPHISLDGEFLGYTDILGNIADPEQDVENRLTQQRVLELVSCLPPAQKQIIILKFIEGLDNREIEQITNRRQGAIRVMQMRALATLRQRLGNEIL